MCYYEHQSIELIEHFKPLEQFKNPSSKLEIVEKTKKLSIRKKQLVDNCYSLL
jgi:hypothetical protein